MSDTFPLLQKRGKYYEQTEFQHLNSVAFNDITRKPFFGLLKLTAMGLLRLSL
jgi:hypothetical protein